MNASGSGPDDGLGAQARRWVERTLGAGWFVTAVVPLAGGISTPLHVLDVVAGSTRRRVVLRRFTNEAWNRREPDLAARTAANLELLMGSGVPAPRLLGHDATGDACGYPAVLTSHVPGEVVLRPGTGWYRQLAERLPEIHAIEAPGHPWAYRPWYDLSQWTPPPWTERHAMWERVGEVVRGPAPASPTHLIHRDFHPANVLWTDGRVSGIVDWVNSCRGPAGVDVGGMRRNLAHLFGGEAPDRFLAAYLSESGIAEYDPYWDLITAVEVLPGPEVYRPYLELGATGLTDSGVQRRFEDHVAAAVSRL